MAEAAGQSKLPGRDEMIGRIDALVEDGRHAAVLIVEVAGFDQLLAVDESDAGAVVREVEKRLDRLVRGRDALGFVEPARFVLGCPALAVEAAGGLAERIRGGAALPVDVAGESLSLTLDIGMAFSDGKSDGLGLLEAAEADLERSRPKG